MHNNTSIYRTKAYNLTDLCEGGGKKRLSAEITFRANMIYITHIHNFTILGKPPTFFGIINLDTDQYTVGWLT